MTAAINDELFQESVIGRNTGGRRGARKGIIFRLKFF
jgi:hypothetical protein